MKVKREENRKQRQEVFDLDNEEGYVEEDKVLDDDDEMTDKSDTDVEDDDFDEQFDDEEEVIEEEKEVWVIESHMYCVHLLYWSVPLKHPRYLGRHLFPKETCP